MLYPPTRRTGPPVRVVVTGAGIITAHGNGWQPNAEAFRAGKISFKPVSLFDVSRQRAKIAAQVELPAALPATKLHPKIQARMGRSARFLLHASSEAWKQADWEASDSLPIVLGTTSGGMSLGENYLRQAIQHPRARRQQATKIVNYQVQREAMNVCEACGFEGPILIISNACASGANAIGHAWQLIRSGQFARVLAGGYDALCQLTYAGFDSLQALSVNPCRPFDAGRDGLCLGEGAGMFAMESYEHARLRGANILGEIIGYGSATDVHHLTQPQPQGAAALSAMRAACMSAKIAPEQVDYVNAHGTATVQNDAAEAEAINRWAEAFADKVSVSSTKAGIGHLLGGAGAVEAVICLLALHGQWLPPQITMGKPDPLCRFSIVNQPMDAKINLGLTNSFGFGGANASLILRRWS